MVTSPPYWGLRDYQVDGMIGLEPTFQEHLDKMVEVCREIRRVLRPDGTFWLNYGDAYAASSKGTGGHNPKQDSNTGSWHDSKFDIEGFKPKDLMMMPARIAIALQADGWWLRSEIIWHKPNPMPESVTDRPTSSHEKIYLLTKSSRYFYNSGAAREESRTDPDSAASMTFGSKSGKLNTEQLAHSNKVGKAWEYTKTRNLRNVWTMTTQPYPEAHFATFPEALPMKCIIAGSAEGDIILDPFSGSATTGLAALKLNRKYIGIELNPDYIDLSIKRIEKEARQAKLFV